MKRMEAYNIFQETANKIISGANPHQAIEKSKLDSRSHGEYWMEFHEECNAIEFWTDGDGGEELITFRAL